MNKFHLGCMAFLCLLCIQLSALDNNTILMIRPLTGSGACSPQITCPPDITISDGLGNSNNTGLPYSAVAYNFCETPNVSYNDEVSTGLCNTEITRLWTAVSFNNNTEMFDISQCRQKILLTPRCKLECPPNACVSISDDLSEGFLGRPQASGTSCTLTDLSFEDSDNILCDEVRQISRLWTGYFSQYKDCSVTCIQTITVDDDTAPVISNCPENIIIESNCDIVQWEEPNTNDNCKTVTLSSNYTPGLSEFSLGSTIVRYKATDICGNESECEFVVSVLEDNTHPDCPDDIIIVTDDINPIEVLWEAPEYLGSCTECPSARTIGGYTFIGSTNGSDFYISTKAYYYEEASKEASRLGGYIASISNEDENNLIADNSHSLSLLIGLTDVNSEGRFTWDSGESLSYENWFYNQPNDHNNNQDYVEMMVSGQWNDIENKKLCYVLEIPCDFVKQTGGPRLGERLYPGNYTISYTIEDGCDISMCCEFDIEILFDGSTSATNTREEITNKNLQQSTKNTFGEDIINIYPNPVSDNLNIEVILPNNIEEISLITLDGKRVSVLNEINQINSFSTSELIPGLHLVVIEFKSGEIKYEKIMKI